MTPHVVLGVTILLTALLTPFLGLLAVSLEFRRWRPRWEAAGAPDPGEGVE